MSLGANPPAQVPVGCWRARSDQRSTPAQGLSGAQGLARPASPRPVRDRSTARRSWESSGWARRRRPGSRPRPFSRHTSRTPLRSGLPVARRGSSTGLPSGLHRCQGWGRGRSSATASFSRPSTSKGQLSTVSVTLQSRLRVVRAEIKLLLPVAGHLAGGLPLCHVPEGMNPAASVPQSRLLAMKVRHPPRRR